MIEFDLFCNSACGSAAWFSSFFSSACGSFLQDAVLAFVVFLAFAAPPSVKFTPFALKRSSFKFAPVSSAWFVFSASLAFFRICVTFASSVRVAFDAALASAARVAVNEPSKFGTLFVSIAPIVADAVLAPVASIAASAPSVPLAFSALLASIVASGLFAFSVSLAAAALFICVPCFVTICSQVKARFLPGTERLNLALTETRTSRVQFTPFEPEQF